MAKDKQLLIGESSNGSSKGKQIPERESTSLRLLPSLPIRYSAYGKLSQSGYTSKGNAILPDTGSTVQTTNHNTMDIESGGVQANHGSSKFRVCFRWCFLFICCSLEVISFVLEVLASLKNNPIYALGSMVASIIALILCIAEIVWKVKKEKVKIFGTSPEILVLFAAVLEFIASTITYARRDN